MHTTLLALLVACSGTDSGGGDSGVTIDDTQAPPGDDTGPGSDDTGTATGPVENVTIHVDAANIGDDAADGSSQHPYANLPDAFAAVEAAVAVANAPAVVVEIAPGLYTETGSLDASGRPEAWITIRGASSRPELFGLEKNPGALYINGDYVTVDNVEVGYTTVAGIVVNASHVVIRDSVIHDVGCCGKGKGIAVSNGKASHVLIEGNTLYDNGLAGISVAQISESAIRNNVLVDRGSVVYEPASLIGIVDSDRVVVENNYLRDEADKMTWGLSVETSQGIVVRRNIVLDAQQAALYATGANGLCVVSNTLVNIEDRGRDSGLLQLEGTKGGNTALVVRGNVFDAIDGPLVALGQTQSVTLWGDNAYWSDEDWFATTGGSHDLAGWQNETGYDAASIGVEGLSEITWSSQPADFAPEAASPLRDALSGVASLAKTADGKVLTLDDPCALWDGYAWLQADSVVVGGAAASVTGSEGATVTLDKAVSAEVGTPVAWPHAGEGMDFGAVEADMPTQVGDAAGAAEVL